jgi:hypothetical protein
MAKFSEQIPCQVQAEGIESQAAQTRSSFVSTLLETQYNQLFLSIDGHNSKQIRGRQSVKSKPIDQTQHKTRQKFKRKRKCICHQ